MLSSEHSSTSAQSPLPAGTAIRRTWILNGAVLLLAMGFSALAAVSAGQTLTWDLKNYHLYGTYALLHKPLHYDFAPSQVQSFLNPILHIPTYLAFEYLPPKAVAAVLGAIQGINIFIVFLIAQLLFSFWRDWLRTVLSLSCAVAGFYGAASLGELGTTFGENILSLFVLWGLLLLLKYILCDPKAGPPPRYLLVTAGLVMGAAFGLKMTVGPYVLAAFFAFIAVAIWQRRGIRPVLQFSISMGLAFICTYGYWGTALYLEYKNPFFPYFNAIFKSPFFDPVNGGDARFFPRNLQQQLFYPFFFAHRNNLACEITFRDVRFAYCYVAIIVLLLYAIGRFIFSRRNFDPEKARVNQQTVPLFFLTLFISLSYAAWQVLFSVYRYILVLELLVPLFLACILLFIIRNKTYAAATSMLLSILIVHSVVPFKMGEAATPESLNFSLPQIAHLDKNVVVMAGSEPTAYVALRFPATTRFIRISSNFIHPGQNSRIDERIRKVLKSYGANNTLVYLANRNETRNSEAELSYYGLSIDVPSCINLQAGSQSHGTICRTFPKATAKETETALAFREYLTALSDAKVKLRITPKVASAGKDTIFFRFTGLHSNSIDMLYTINGKQQEPIKNWSIGSKGQASVLVGSESEKGIYHILAIRESNSQSSKWIRSDAVVEIK